MRTCTLFRIGVIVFAGCVLAFTASAQRLTGVSQLWSGVGNAPNANLPQIESLLLGEESWTFVDRTHELTSARFDPVTGLLATANTNTLVGFPSYLLGAQYVANANANRTAGDINTPNSYTVTYTLNGPATAYLLIDTRMDGQNSNATGKANTSDPSLGGSMAWVVTDGWLRVNTGIMPNGQADYLGIDEGRSVASPDLRDHTGSGLVAGPGEGLNNFFAIYYRSFTAGPGSFETRGIRQSTGSGNMYVVAVIPEPGTVSLLASGLLLLGLGLRRHRAP